ncbi:glycosyltransferase [Flavobacterium sp.]|uniref:glycosyltransferase n=1 Tax=Flavobacterium sp. TaxID=239 RepID=UPI0039E40103
MSNKKRIGLVLPNHPSYSETFFISKIKGLQQKGMEVVMFTNAPKKKDFKLCPVVYLKTKLSFISFIKEAFIFLYIIFTQFKRVILLFSLNKKDKMRFFKNIKNIFLNRYFLNQKLDWLHFGFGTMALERENVAQTINAKMAVSFRGFDWYVYPVKNENCYQKLFKKEVKYHVLSKGMKSDLIQYGIHEEKIDVISPFIDVVKFHNNYDSFLKNNKETKIISIGRLHWIKGYNYIFEALSILKSKGIHFKYSIIGDGLEKERLLFQAQQLGISDNVTFYGKVDHDELSKIVIMHDVFIQYSNQEGFCNAVLEAQSMELLCVVSDADGLKENVVDGKTGWIVPKRSPLKLANKLDEIVKLSFQESEIIKNNARQRVEQNFNFEIQINNFITFYNK